MLLTVSKIYQVIWFLLSTNTFWTRVTRSPRSPVLPDEACLESVFLHGACSKILLWLFWSPQTVHFYSLNFVLLMWSLVNPPALPPAKGWLLSCDHFQFPLATHDVRCIYSDFLTHPSQRKAPPSVLLGLLRSSSSPSELHARTAHTWLVASGCERIFFPSQATSRWEGSLSAYLPINVLQLRGCFFSFSFKKRSRECVLFNSTESHHHDFRSQNLEAWVKRQHFKKGSGKPEGREKQRKGKVHQPPLARAARNPLWFGGTGFLGGIYFPISNQGLLGCCCSCFNTHHMYLRYTARFDVPHTQLSDAIYTTF